MPPLTNPFVPPGNEENPDGPLCPADNRDHLAWYIDEVAEHGPCFTAFEELLETRREVLGRSPASRSSSPLRGQLIVVEGPEGCGKTSLVNRLVLATQEQVPAPFVVKTMDLRFIDTIDDNGMARSGSELHRVACRELLDRADWLGGDARHRAESMIDREDFSAGSFYELMSRSAHPELVILVLLPAGSPDTSVQYLGRYDNWARPGILFIAERITTPYSETLSPTAQHGQHSLPMRTLQLRGLRPGEAGTVIEKRLRGRTPSISCPRVPPESLTWLEGFTKEPQFSTIGWVVKTFRKIFESRATGTPRPDQLDSIPWSEIAEHLVTEHFKGGRQP